MQIDIVRYFILMCFYIYSKSFKTKLFTQESATGVL